MVLFLPYNEYLYINIEYLRRKQTIFYLNFLKSRHEELSGSLSSSTRPLLRQIESLQASLSEAQTNRFVIFIQIRNIYKKSCLHSIKSYYLCEDFKTNCFFVFVFVLATRNNFGAKLERAYSLMVHYCKNTVCYKQDFDFCG